MSDLFGQPHVPARRSALRGRKLSAQIAKAETLCGILDELALRYAQIADEHGLPTSGTFGRKYGGSSPSADLQDFTVSKLQAATGLCGSPLFELQWKSSAMLLGPPICQLVASARRTSGKDFGSWPTPNTPSGGRSIDPSKMSATGVTLDGKKHTVSLEHVVNFATWPTPKAQDGERGGQAKRAESRSHLLDYVMLASWVSPMAQDHSRGTNPPRAADTGIPLSQQVGMLASWPSPPATDDKYAGSGETDWLESRGKKGIRLNDHVVHRGPILNGSPAQTEKRGQLNPAFSLWLMGYPEEWVSCGARATRSSHRSPPRSSSPTAKRED